MGGPPATTSLSNSARLDVIATRISIAAAPFCDTHVKMDLVDGQEVKRCSYPWRLAAAKGVNAKADGKSIAINADLLDFVASDDEVALVFGHELAHNTMHHLDKQRGNAILGTVAGVLVSAALGVNVGGAFSQIGRGMYSQSFEAEADYVGVYYAALAGYDYHGAAAFMRRMGAEHPQAISHGSSHPPTAERYVALEKAAREIDGKIARGEPLIPNGVELAGRDRAQSSSMAQSSSEPISATPPPGEDSYSHGVPGR
ncbi:MAG TPA: M48 family metallopeptidase [Stellaceae bacterium]